MADEAKDAAPALVPLTAKQVQRIASIADRREFAPGDTLVTPGEEHYPFLYLESGTVEVVRDETPDRPEVVLRTWGEGNFLGEWGFVTGQRAFLRIRAVERGVALEIPRRELLQLLSTDADLSELVMREFVRRRRGLRSGEGATSVEILGNALSGAAHQLRTWAERQQIVYTWLDIDEPAGASLAAALGCLAEDLPVVLTPTETIPHATVGQLSESLGLSYRATDDVHDLVVIGGGPAGLAAAVYGTSEGLETVLLDGVSVGGQAAASSRIENYLGFPSGISGGELMARGLVQAERFGTIVNTPCTVDSITRRDGGRIALTLSDGTEITTRSVVIATGAQYSRLPLRGWREFEGQSIYFSATEIEAQTCGGSPVAVIGGANSAGQAAIFLASRAERVQLVVRGPDLSAKMSDYLVRRVREHPRIDLRLGSQVTGLYGNGRLTEVEITRSDDGTVERCAASALFCFIGAVPATRWIDDLVLDEDGFILTDSELDTDALPAWGELGRAPLPFETSIPGVFAVGDVRRASMKRVAAAVGEGSSAIMSVHRAIAAVD